MSLRAVHCRLESTVDADLNQTHQGGNVVGHARDELLQSRRRRRPILPRDSRVRGELHDAEAQLGYLLGNRPPEQRHFFAAVGVLLEQTAHDREPVVGHLPPQLDLGHCEQQLRIVARRLDCQILSRRREIAARYQHASQMRTQLTVRRVEARRFAQCLDGLVLVSPGFELRRQFLELIGRGCVFAGPRQIASPDKRPCQVRAQFAVIRLHARHFGKRLQRGLLMARCVKRFGQRLQLLGRRRAFAGASKIAAGDEDIEQALSNLVVIRRQGGRLA